MIFVQGFELVHIEMGMNLFFTIEDFMLTLKSYQTRIYLALGLHILVQVLYI